MQQEQDVEPDEHGWWPLFRYAGTVGRDEFPVWQKARYWLDSRQEWNGQVQRSWDPPKDTRVDAGVFPGSVLKNTMSLPLEPAFARPETDWDWQPLHELDPQWTDSAAAVEIRYEEMRSSPILSMANARLFAVDLAHPYPKWRPWGGEALDPTKQYTMQMVLDDRASLNDWTYYDSSKHPAELMMVIRRVTHVRVVETNGEVPVPKEVWNPELPAPRYVATRGRYDQFLRGTRMEIGPNDSAELAHRFNSQSGPVATWMLNSAFQNMGNAVLLQKSRHPEPYLSNPMSLRLRLHLPARVADESARTDPYTLAQERGEVPRYRVSMAQAARAVLCANRWNKGFLCREWGLQGRQKEAGKRAIAELQRGGGSSSSSTRTSLLPSLAGLRV